MNNLQLITDEDGLNEGQYYWVQEKRPMANGSYPKPHIAQCIIRSGHKCLDAFWANRENPSAFEQWFVKGPVPAPSFSEFQPEVCKRDPLRERSA